MTAVQNLEFVILIILAVLFIIIAFYIFVKSKTQERRLKKKIKELEDMVNTDYLTNVYSRFSFISKVNDILAVNPCGTLLIFDIDGFKKINDSYGHIEGDRLLKSFAERLKNTFDSDLVGRLGGDEFLVYISGSVTNEAVTEKIKKADIALFYDKATKLKLSTCCGGSMAPDEGISFDELYAKADKALYESKNNHKSVSFSMPQI